MIVITSNRKGPTHLDVKVGKKNQQKLMLPGDNIIDDPAWEKAITADANFKRWCTEATLNVHGHHLDKNPEKLDTLFSLTTFEEKDVDKNAAQSPFRFIPSHKLTKVIANMGDMKVLELVREKDPRPEVQNAARKRIEVILAPAGATENQN